jgi:hypothetical protein
MPTTYAIPNGRTAMDATTYTGNGSTQTVVNADKGTTGFRPDLVWYKGRSAAFNHRLFDSNRGVSKDLSSNLTDAEGTISGVTAFNSNGFTLGSEIGGNQNASTYVAWQWVAGQGVNNTNTVGSITSTVSANTTTGFSMVTYTGTGTTGTVGHGLSTAPSMVILKARNQPDSWLVYHIGCPNPATNTLILNSNAAVQTSSPNWNSLAPTSSVINVYNPGSGGYSNGNGYTYVAYCWAPVAGFSAFGNYTGNGSTDGPFIYLGFKPKFWMIKKTDSANAWLIWDSTRTPQNPNGVYLVPDSNGVEGTYNSMDFLSNGIKWRATDGSVNGSGGNYIYAAFAENPFKFANAG